jgi:AAA+ ATPase superfamily predicted ATPase
MMPHTKGLPEFVGRRRELAALGEQLAQVRESGMGRFVQIRGRRRVGKSWLVEEFVLRHATRHVFFTASRNPVDGDLARFSEALAQSSLPEEARSGGVSFASWEAALTTAANGATSEQPSVIIIDEFPYLGGDSDEAARAVESLFSATWERRLSRLPVMLILVGSDLAMMERLAEYGRPLYDRISRALAVDPLSPSDIATIAKLGPEETIDAYAVIGGLPAFAAGWRRAGGLREFLLGALSGPDTPFVNSALRILDAEFPAQLQARTILSAIGHGERTMKAISSATGIQVSNLAKPVALLTEAKRIIRAEEPLSAQPLHAPRYSVADSYLRFWLRFIEREMPAIERLRTEDVVERILAQWPDARGRFVEPIVRDALERHLPDERLRGAGYVRSYWTRTNDPEIDLIGGDRPKSPATIAFVGSIKWRETAPFDSGDLEQLIKKSAMVPGVGASTPLVAVSRSGIDGSARKLTLAISPSELVSATG